MKEDRPRKRKSEPPAYSDRASGNSKYEEDAYNKRPRSDPPYNGYSERSTSSAPPRRDAHGPHQSSVSWKPQALDGDQTETQGRSSDGQNYNTGDWQQHNRHYKQQRTRNGRAERDSHVYEKSIQGLRHVDRIQSPPRRISQSRKETSRQKQENNHDAHDRRNLRSRESSAPGPRRSERIRQPTKIKSQSANEDSVQAVPASVYSTPHLDIGLEKVENRGSTQIQSKEDTANPTKGDGNTSSIAAVCGSGGSDGTSRSSNGGKENKSSRKTLSSSSDKDAGHNSEYALLFCANIPGSMDEEDLRGNFRRFEGLKSINFDQCKYLPSGRYAILEFNSLDGAQLAHDRKRNWRIDGVHIKMALYKKPQDQAIDSHYSEDEADQFEVAKLAKKMTNEEAAKLWTDRFLGVSKLEYLFRDKDMGDGKCHEKYYDEGLRLAQEFPKDRPIQSVARKYDETFKCIFQMIAQIEERREAFPTPRDLKWSSSDNKLKVSERSCIRESIIGLDECLKQIEYHNVVFNGVLGRNHYSEGSLVYKARHERNELSHYANGYLRNLFNYRGLHKFINTGIDNLKAYAMEMQDDSLRRLETARKAAKERTFSFARKTEVGVGVWGGIGASGGNADDAEEGEISDPDEA